MLIKDIIDEDFINYKKPSMFIGTVKCDWKCCIEGKFDKKICQNYEISHQKNLNVSNEFIFNRYINNPITQSIVFGGLEPILQFEEILNFIKFVRMDKKCIDDIVIYTGYNLNEIEDKVNILKNYKNIIIKFGRFIPNNKIHYDEILGVYLASDNQYALKIN